MAVRVQGQRIQHTHPAEAISTVDGVKIIQQGWNGSLLSTEDGTGFCEADVFRGEQFAFADQFSVMEVQIVGHRMGANDGCNLGCQKFRERFDFVKSASAFIKVDVRTFPHPALGVITIRTKLWGNR